MIECYVLCYNLFEREKIGFYLIEREKLEER
jgi:hypothetical protein